MPEAPIAIISGWDGGLGRGHIQRMASLLDHLVHRTDMPAVLIAGRPPDFFPEDLRRYVLPAPAGRVALFVRDMRDSTAEEIRLLQKTAPVLCVDDLGPGRDLADRAVDLLPNPARPDRLPDGGLFLHGYGFRTALAALGDAVVPKTIDCVVYAGAASSDDDARRLLALVPDDSACAVFRGRGSFLRRGSSVKAIGQDGYARLLLSSRLLISHFGISLYEARAALCRPVALNPTEYHSNLCDIAPEELGIVNLGTRDSLDPSAAAAAIREILAEPPVGEVSASAVYSAVRENLDRFCALLRTML